MSWLAAALALLCGVLGYLAGRLRTLRQLQEQERARVAAESESELRLRGVFEGLAAQTLHANSEQFLRLAREMLGREQTVGASTLKEREQAIAQLVAPLASALAQTQVQVHALEKERRDAFAELRTQIEALTSGQAQLARETRNLVTALRRPEVRGRWGELTLRRVVELAGMIEHCDFTEQVHVATPEGVLRPDLIVHLPEGRDLVVDVKTPLDAYLEALEAPTEEARAQALKRHAQQLEMRVRELAGKRYWAQFERSPAFAVLFLPGDQFLSAALAERPQLLEQAFAQAIILATPSTLMALLKSVAYGWRQATLAENAALIRELAEELYRRLGQFTGHVSRLGQRLGAAVEAYNAAVGSLERQVLPQARRFPGLGVSADAPLPELSALEPLASAAEPAAATAEPGAASAPSAPSAEPAPGIAERRGR
jgi:DNA recombination protein RmuC